MVTFLRYFLSLMVGIMTCGLGCQLNAMKQVNPLLTTRTALTAMNFSPFSYNMAYWHAKVRNVKEKINRQELSDALISEAESLIKEAKTAGQASFAKQVEEMIAQAKQTAANQATEDITRKVEHYKKVYGEQTAQNRDLEAEVTKLRLQLAQAHGTIKELQETSKEHANQASYYKKTYAVEQERAQKAEAKVAEQEHTIEWLQQEHKLDDTYNQQLVTELNQAKTTLKHAQQEINALGDEMLLLKTEASISDTMLQIVSEKETKLKKDAFDHARYATSLYKREAEYFQQIQQLKRELAESQQRNAMLTEDRERNVQDKPQLIATGSGNIDTINHVKNENLSLHQSFNGSQEELEQAQQTIIQLQEQLERITKRYTRLCGNIAQITSGKSSPEHTVTASDLLQIESKINSLASLSITVKTLEENLKKALVGPDAQKYKSSIVKAMETIKQAISRNKLW